ncbi:MAG: thiamine phosphate synthase [Pseudomonadota bacterium]
MDGVYLVTDRPLCGSRELAAVVAAAAGAGVSAVQLREKHATTRQFMETAQMILALLRPRGIPLIINDRIDVALAVGADGVHVGQTDMPAAIARQLMGPGAIIGLSVETWIDVVAAEDLDVTYLGISPVFETPTKTDTGIAWGLAGVARIRAFSRHPLVAIGGLNADNAADVVAAGADSIAVVSAICAAADPAQAVRHLKRAVDAGRARRRIRL